MFRFIGKSLVLGALAVGGLVFMYGKDQVFTWVKQGKKKIEQQVSELQGMTAELRKIEGRVGSLEEEVRHLKESAIREEVEIDQIDQETHQRQVALDTLHARLAKAQTLLEGGAERFRIGGIEYSRAEVERDVAEKIDLYKVQDETLAQLKQTLETHKSALAIARENVAKGESLRTELAGRVRLLQAKLEKQRAREVYAEAVACDFNANDFNTEIGEVRKAFNEFETRLTVKDRMIDERLKVASGVHLGGIDYEAREQAAPANVLERLTELLNPQATAPAAVVVVTGR